MSADPSTADTHADHPHFNNFLRLHLWSLEGEFDRVVFLDTDVAAIASVHALLPPAVGRAPCRAAKLCGAPHAHRAEQALLAPFLAIARVVLPPSFLRSPNAIAALTYTTHLSS